MKGKAELRLRCLSRMAESGPVWGRSRCLPGAGRSRPADKQKKWARVSRDQALPHSDQYRQDRATFKSTRDDDSSQPVVGGGSRGKGPRRNRNSVRTEKKKQQGGTCFLFSFLSFLLLSLSSFPLLNHSLLS
jgi:hypothetical protein